MDTVYLGSYLKEELGWHTRKSKKRKADRKEYEEQKVMPNTHGIIMNNGMVFVVFIHPKREWKNKNTPKIHWLNTKHKNWKTASYEYTYEDMKDMNKDNNELWKKDRKTYKRYRKITSFIDISQILVIGFTLTTMNRLRSNTKKELIYRLKQLSKPKSKPPIPVKPRKEPKEYSYLLTIIDVFSKYAFVFALETHTGVENAINLHELFTQKTQYNPTPYKPKLLLSDIGTELKNPHTNFVCKYNNVFQIYALPQRPLGIIERFNQTFKRKMKRAIYEGRMTKYNFTEMIRRLTTEYNSTTHSSTRYKPTVAHFSTNPQTAFNIFKRMQKIKEKNEMKFNPIEPLHLNTTVRVLSTKDPTLSSKERNEIIQAFTFKKYARPLWTKHTFTIHKVLPNNYYLLRDNQNIYKKRFHQTELLKRRLQFHF
jgi:hypothetical protein